MRPSAAGGGPVKGASKGRSQGGSGAGLRWPWWWCGMEWNPDGATGTAGGGGEGGPGRAASPGAPRVQPGGTLEPGPGRLEAYQPPAGRGAGATAPPRLEGAGCPSSPMLDLEGQLSWPWWWWGDWTPRSGDAGDGGRRAPASVSGVTRHTRHVGPGPGPRRARGGRRRHVGPHGTHVGGLQPGPQGPKKFRTLGRQGAAGGRRAPGAGPGGRDVAVDVAARLPAPRSRGQHAPGAC